MIRDSRKMPVKIKYVNEIAPNTYACVGIQVHKNCAQMRIIAQQPESKDPNALGITVEKFGRNSAVIFTPQLGGEPWMYIFTEKSNIEAVKIIAEEIKAGVDWFEDLLMIAYKMSTARSKAEVQRYRDKLERVGIDEKGNVPRPGYKGKGMCSVCLERKGELCSRYDKPTRNVARNCKGNS